MRIAMFGEVNESGFLPNWTDEEIVVIFGSARLDLSQLQPGYDAALSVFALFGAVKVCVPEGTRVTLGGFSLFGSRSIKVQPGAGPAIHMTLTAIFGSIEIVSENEPPAAE